MLRFVIRKMFSKKWMVLSLLIGNILLISIASGNPMYTHAVFQRTLTKNLETYLTEKNAYPGRITLRIGNPTNNAEDIARYQEAAQGMPEAFGVEALHEIAQLSTSIVSAELDQPRDDAEHLQLRLNTMTGLEEHIKLVAGRMYSTEPDEEGVIEAIVSQSALIQTPLLLDDVVTLPRLLTRDGVPARVRIVGVFTNSESEDVYWVNAPRSYAQSCFIDGDLFRSLFLYEGKLQSSLTANWYVLLDYTAMQAENAEHMLATANEYRSGSDSPVPKGYSDNFTTTLTDYIATAKKVNATLWVLQVPVFVLLAAFIFMVSRQMIETEQNEIAVIKSRGAGRGQIFAMYLIQSLVISLLAYVLGIALGVYLCQVLGASNAFLEFVRRSALPVEITGEALGYAGVASLLSIGAMVLPAIRYSKIGIVTHKRQKNRRSSAPLWQKAGLDFILLLVALYGLYSFNGQKDLLAMRVQDGASLDPLLFLSSSLFMIGSGLLAVRLTPVMVWVIYRLLRRAWSPALYASFLHVLRTRTSQGFIMVFLIITIALGVFNAQAARTINQNTEDNLHYSIGADVVLQEKWASSDNEQSAAPSSPSSAPSAPASYIEPDFGRFESLEGAESITKVYVNENIIASVSGGTVQGVQLMGIHTKEFGETAWFKDSLSDIHWYHYLNALSKNSNAILVSRSFQTSYNCKIGDSISYRTSAGDSLRGTIYGFVDYFPGFEPVTYKKGSDGLYKEEKNHLIVAHLQKIQSTWGVTPYQIWVKNKDSSAYLYDFAQENQITFTTFKDASALLVEKKNDPVLQGTNGILTVGFMVVLILCSVGFLIYWILSIQSRSLLFGIFRAMGMTMREVFTMLINEQVFISGLSIAVGALVGHWTARLYMPLIQLGYAASDNAIPLEVVSQSVDQLRLLSVVGAVMLVCMIILGTLISHMKVTQALKLGED